MAFSAFRAMMGSAGKSVVITNTNTFTPNVATILNDGTYFGNNAGNTIIGGNTSYYCTVYKNSNSTLEASLFQIVTGYEKFASSGNLKLTYNGTSTDGDTVDSTHFFAVYNDNTNAASAAYLTNTTGTLSITANAALGPLGANTSDYLYCACYSSIYALVVGLHLTTSTFEMVNPTNLSSYTNGVGATDFAIGSTAQVVGLSATLGAFIYMTSGNVIKVQTVDNASGTMTINTAVSTGVTTNTATNAFGAVKLTSTTFFLVYNKTASVIGARIITLGAGGSVSVGSEYTYTTTASTSVLVARPATLSSTSVAVSYSVNPIDSNGNQGYLISASISGSTITFGNNPYSYTTNGNWHADGNLCAIDSTRVGILYTENDSSAASLSTNTGRTGLATLNSVSPTWGTWTGNFLNKTNVASTMSNIGDMAYLGSNMCLLAYLNSTSVELQTTFLSSENVYLSSQTTVANGFATYPSVCALGFSTTVRALLCYVNASNVASFSVVSVAAGGGLTVNTAATSTVSGTISNVNGNYKVLNLSANSTLFINRNTSDLTQLYGQIVTTSGTSVTAAGTNAALGNTTTGQTITGTSNSFFQVAKISSTSFIAAYFNKDASNTYVTLCIFTVSGTTITSGTPVTVYTDATGLFGGSTLGVAVFSNNTGIVTYGPAGGTSHLYGNGFSFSGTTITVGTQNTLITTPGFTLTGQRSGNTMVPLSTTEAMFNNAGASGINSGVVTYTNNNTLSMGTVVNSDATALTTGTIIEMETNNGAVVMGNTSTQVDVSILYRG